MSEFTWYLPDGAEIYMRDKRTRAVYLARVIDGVFVRVEGPALPDDPALLATEEMLAAYHAQMPN